MTLRTNLGYRLAVPLGRPKEAAPLAGACWRPSELPGTSQYGHGMSVSRALRPRALPPFCTPGDPHDMTIPAHRNEGSVRRYLALVWVLFLYVGGDGGPHAV